MALLIMTLFITINKKHMCNVTFTNVIGKVVISKLCISIVVVCMCLVLLSNNFLNAEKATQIRSSLFVRGGNKEEKKFYEMDT
jgi:hypothetical protein